MKKAVLPILIITGVLFLLIYLRPTGDGLERGKSGKRLVIASRLWSQPNEKEFIYNNIIRPFEKQHNCRVDFQVFNNETMLKRAQVQTMTKNITTDMVIVYVSDMAQWVDTGMLDTLTPFEKRWQGRTFLKKFNAMTVFNKQRYFLPIGADDYLLCINKAVLEYLPKGVDIQTIDWAQLVDVALKIAKAEGRGRFAITGITQKMLIYQIGCIVLSYGGGFPDLSSAGAVSAWHDLIRLKQGLIPAWRTIDSVVPCMKRGEAWIAISHNARIGEIYSSSPMKFIVAPVPKGPAGRGSVTGVSGLALMKNAPNRELALNFMEYITRPGIQNKIAKGTGGFIPTVEESITQLSEGQTLEAVIHSSMAVLKTGKLAYIPAYRDWGAVKLYFDEAFEKTVFEDGRIDQTYLNDTQAKIDALKEQPEQFSQTKKSKEANRD